MIDLDKISLRLADWLLSNHKELKQAVEAEEYQGSVCLPQDGGLNDYHQRDSLDSSVERFIISTEYHTALVNRVQVFIYSLDSMKFSIYFYKYEQNKMIKEIAEALKTISVDTVNHKLHKIKLDLLDELEEEGVILENIFKFRLRYKYIGRKENVKNYCKNLGNVV
jgi:hypothetical protein